MIVFLTTIRSQLPGAFNVIWPTEQYRQKVDTGYCYFRAFEWYLKAAKHGSLQQNII
ncbi:hypothetical protein Glove_140g16 [Diversispora epigaea]|uniref:Uncharacterized protein n=1 Tax=Diversispora epigaea TaxID=1348612 RepID=A0A397J4N1_9GLOM|nr:hypothetical protein Glove_140g16 [Diversispora epigaea]